MTEIETAYRWDMAEMSIAGCVLCAPAETLPTVRSILQTSDFASDSAKMVFRAGCELLDAKQPIDPVTIQAKAKELGTELSSDWIKEAMQGYLTTANVAKNAEIVKAASADRAGREIGFALQNGDISLNEAAEQIHSAMAGQRASLPTPSEDASLFYQRLTEAASGTIKPFTPSGYDELDEMLGGGLIESGMITIAARPGCGKTVLGLCIADNVAATGKSVLYESLEMSREQLWARRVARRTGISYSHLQNGRVSEKDDDAWRRIVEATGDLSRMNVYINDMNAKMDDIERHARSTENLGLVVIDHMGLITPEKMGQDLYTATTYTSHRIKKLAKSLGVPIIALCQLNRASEGRTDKRPTLADLRNSGAIEEDSDAVLLLYREAMYNGDPDKNPWEPEEMEINVAKNRHDSTGVVYVDFTGMISNIRGRTKNRWSHTDADTPFD